MKATDTAGDIHMRATELQSYFSLPAVDALATSSCVVDIYVLCI